MNELFDTYNETVTQLLARLEADLAGRSPPVDVQWKQAITEIRQNMVHMKALRTEELDAALSEQRARLARLGELYQRVTRAVVLGQLAVDGCAKPAATARNGTTGAVHVSNGSSGRELHSTREPS